MSEENIYERVLAKLTPEEREILARLEAARRIANEIAGQSEESVNAIIEDAKLIASNISPQPQGEIEDIVKGL